MKWIKCSDALPDYDTTVMTYSPTSSEPIWPAYLDCDGSNDVWMGLMGSSIDDALITHWMEFPEPPEEL
jgi:hypothetical protein